MSGDQRPPGPPKDPTAPAGEPAGGAGAGDTPREGVPAFDDLDIEFVKDTVPPVGPSPDHASEYVPPRPLPKPVEHQTMENVPIALSPDIDPRRMRTQKAMHVLKREEAAKALVEMGIAPPTTSVVEVPPESKGSSKIVTVIVVLLVLVLGGYAAYTYMQKSGAAPADPSAGVVAIPNGPVEPTAVQPPAPPPTPAVTEPTVLAPTPAASQAPEPASEAIPTPALPAAPSDAKRPRKPSKDAPRPINE